MKIIRKVFALLLSATFLLTPNTVLAVETDTTGPIITVVSCDRENETLYDGDSITLTFSVEDPSGIGSNVGMLMTYRDPNGENYREFLGPTCKLNSTTGYYECEFTVSSTHKVGTYVFAKLHAYDAVGNYTYIRPACSFVVSGTETDTVGPTITEISCDKANETLCEGDSIKYTFKLEDPSGIGSNIGMLMTYTNPEGEGYTEFGGPACVYNSETGLYECVFTVSSSHKVGTYEFAKLHAYDQKGNQSYIRPDKYFYVGLTRPSPGPDQDIVNSGECGLYGDNVIWQLDSSGTLTFSGEGDMADYSWTNFVPNTPWYQHRSSIKKIVIGNGIYSIGDSAFYKLNYVTSIQMSDDVVALGAYSFASCSNITEIQLPNNLQQIANYCFEDCSKLISIVIPNSVSKLGDCSFTGCSKLQNVKLPSNISILPRGVFSECESLEKIEIPNSVTEFVSYCFRDCTGLKSIVFPSGLKTIGYRAFSGCTGLEQLIIPNTVTSIGAEAFYDCTGLKRLELPNAITEIPSSLCYGCTNLENIEIPSTVTKIGSSAFSKCTKLSNVALRNGLKEIESSAFYMCINLKCLFVPDSVISIGKNAFGYYKNSYDQPAIIPEARVLCFANTEGEKYAQESNLLYSVIEIDINSADCEYTGMEVVPNVVIMIDNVTLKKDTDFTVVYENNIDIGTAIIRVNFINDYLHITGTVIKDFRIGKLLSKCEIKLDKDDYQYKMYLPEVTITSDDLTLEINKDYEVYYSLAGETWKKPGANTTKALWALGSCSVKIVGINGYIGEKIITVTVNKFNLQNAKVIVNDNPFDLQNFEYDGTEKKQSNVIVRDSNHNTISNAFYEISYKNNINVGTATMIITGKGDYYTGTLKKTFQIYPRAISNIEVTKMPDKLTYIKCDSKIDVSGGQITIYYRDGGKEIVDITEDMLNTNINFSMGGTHNVWITYRGYSVCFQISIENTMHTYDHGCDTDCNVCGETRTTSHKYSNNCDASCNVCGATRTPPHSYKTSVTKATTSKNGKITKICSGCKKKVTSTIYYAKSFSLSKTSFTYNGKVQTPTVTVKDAKGKVIDPKYYTVSYSSGRKNVGTYKVTIKLKGNYSGSKTLSYKINPISISKCQVSISGTSYTYNGKVIKPSVKVLSAGGSTLKNGTHYTVTYSKGCKAPGTYKVTVKMKGSYSGSKTFTYKINPISISKCKVSISGTSYYYNGKVIKPSVKVQTASGSTLKNGTHYTVSYSSGCKNPGTYKVVVKMKGTYSGSKTFTYTIKPQIKISTCKVSLSGTNYTYNGKVITPSVKVVNAEGTTLKNGTHYTVTYSSGRKNIGTYKVTVKMKGAYTGSKTLTYKINPISISKCKVSISATSYTYDGKTKTPSVKVLSAGGSTLKNGTHYTVSYSSGRKNVGTYKVTVKMKGNYSGSQTFTFDILPPKTSITSLVGNGKTVKVDFAKKTTQVTGYEIQYATDADFTDALTMTIADYNTTSATITELKSGATCYVRVRTYKTVNGVNYYSGWSSVQSINTTGFSPDDNAGWIPGWY